jgi:hypothetical protein
MPERRLKSLARHSTKKKGWLIRANQEYELMISTNQRFEETANFIGEPLARRDTRSNYVYFSALGLTGDCSSR